MGNLTRRQRIITVAVIVGIASVLHLYSVSKNLDIGSSHHTDNHFTVYDVVQNNTDDMSHYYYTKNWYLLVYVAIIAWNWGRVTENFVIDLVLKFSIITILRSLTLNATVLPKGERCNIQKLDVFHRIIGGTCYDKMFSGHFAFGTLVTLLVFKHGVIQTTSENILWAFIINLIHFWIIVVTRAHFTQDILVALYVTLFVHLGVDAFVQN